MRRAQLIDELRAHVDDEAVLAAIAAVPRERFVGPRQRSRAYANDALPIGCEQTISQPLVVARMTELLELRSSDRVLDVGTGSGYHAAVLARLGAHVWSIERHAELAEAAAATLTELAIDNVTVRTGDGTRGLPEAAPFDAINVAAAAAPDLLRELEAQLAVGGRMVAPVLGREQRLVLARRLPEGIARALHEAVRFVPLVRD